MHATFYLLNSAQKGISFEYFAVTNILFGKEDYLIYNFVLGLSWI